MVERLTVDQVVEGSTPFIHPCKLLVTGSIAMLAGFFVNFPFTFTSYKHPIRGRFQETSFSKTIRLMDRI